jgi:hypothetical protein
MWQVIPASAGFCQGDHKTRLKPVLPAHFLRNESLQDRAIGRFLSMWVNAEMTAHFDFQHISERNARSWRPIGARFHCRKARSH